jgi:hypothetical protein
MCAPLAGGRNARPVPVDRPWALSEDAESTIKPAKDVVAAVSQHPLIAFRSRHTVSSVPDLPPARAGVELHINERELEFSFFPVFRQDDSWLPAETVFAVSPWAVIGGAVREKVAKVHRPEALAFLQQAQDFYVTARERLAANPLLYYYAFLNLAKALLRVRRFKGSLDRAHHGLHEPPAVGAGGVIETAKLRVRARNDRACIFPELLKHLGTNPPADNAPLSIRDLLPQVVVGHRQWRNASGGDERFIGIKELHFMQDATNKIVWVRFYVASGDLHRFGVTLERFVLEATPTRAFHAAFSDKPGWYCFESTATSPYQDDPCEGLPGIVKMLRPDLWRIVSSIPGVGYSRYYAQLMPAPGADRLPQIASLWAVLFYFGSIVRYRPDRFDALRVGPFGPFVNEFVSAQPEQLLYLLASEICEREIAKPAIA